MQIWNLIYLDIYLDIIYLWYRTVYTNTTCSHNQTLTTTTATLTCPPRLPQGCSPRLEMCSTVVYIMDVQLIRKSTWQREDDDAIGRDDGEEEGRLFVRRVRTGVGSVTSVNEKIFRVSTLITLSPLSPSSSGSLKESICMFTLTSSLFSFSWLAATSTLSTWCSSCSSPLVEWCEIFFSRCWSRGPRIIFPHAVFFFVFLWDDAAAEAAVAVVEAAAFVSTFRRALLLLFLFFPPPPPLWPDFVSWHKIGLCTFHLCMCHLLRTGGWIHYKEKGDCDDCNIRDRDSWRRRLLKQYKYKTDI